MKQERKPRAKVFLLTELFIGEWQQNISVTDADRRQVIVECITGRMVTRHIMRDEHGDWWAFLEYGPKGEHKLARVSGVK
jgi:hypothetical protein